MTKCTHCGKRLRATSLTVHVADAFAHEAPSGVFCVDKCYGDAVAAHSAVHSPKLKSVGG